MALHSDLPIHRAQLAAAVLQRGHAVNANFRKAYP